LLELTPNGIGKPTPISNEEGIWCVFKGYLKVPCHIPLGTGWFQWIDSIRLIRKRYHLDLKACTARDMLDGIYGYLPMGTLSKPSTKQIGFIRDPYQA